MVYLSVRKLSLLLTMLTLGHDDRPNDRQLYNDMTTINSINLIKSFSAKFQNNDFDFQE